MAAKAAEVTAVLDDHVVVKDVDGFVYLFVNGSLNALRFDLRKVGQKGWIRWTKTPSASFPHFSDSKEPFGPFGKTEPC